MCFKLANANKECDMDIYNERYSTSQVTAATGLPNHTLQSWLKRDLLVSPPGAPIEGGGNPGVHRRFSFQSIVEIAIAKALCDIGLATANAIKAGAHFAHFGQAVAYYPGEQLENFTPRRAGLPFKNSSGGKTLICVSDETSGEFLWYPGTDIFTLIGNKFGNGFVVLNASEVFERTVRALGFDPADVMTRAYPRAGDQ
jgi:hypothetical protein